MELSIYAHPWDLRALGEHGGLARLRAVGFTEVAMAVSYHAGRWLTPWHPDGLVRFLEDGTVHYAPRGDHGRLQPLPSREVRPSGASPLEQLGADAAAAGIAVRAWMVGTHNTRLGERHLDCCVENAVGDRYPYALCPSHPAVQRYLQVMVQDLAAHAGVATIELESFGWLGHRHASHHDKSSFATDAWTDLLLSICFCPACVLAMTAREFAGAPVGAATVAGWRQGFAAALRAHFTAGDCMTTPAQLDPVALGERLRREFGAAIQELVAHRVTMPMQTAQRLQHVRRPGLGGRDAVRLALQTSYDRVRGGAAMPLANLGGLFDEAALTTYAEDVDGVAAALPHLLAARANAKPAPSLRLCCHPRAPQYRSDDDLRRLRTLCEQHAIDSVAVYHLGLLPWATIERVARVLAG